MTVASEGTLCNACCQKQMDSLDYLLSCDIRAMKCNAENAIDSHISQPCCVLETLKSALEHNISKINTVIEMQANRANIEREDGEGGKGGGGVSKNYERREKTNEEKEL